jgi:hypothetical protein
MPSPKHGTRKSPRGPPRSSTRSSPPRAGAAAAAGSDWFSFDPIVEAMARGDLKWSDLIMDVDPKYKYKSRSPASKSPRMPKAPVGSPVTPPYSPFDDVFEGFKTPDLRLRKFIYETFPVVLEEIPSRNGTEKYAVKWHRKNLEEWRSSRTESFEEAMEYQLFSELRLIHSLRQHPRLYALHEPRTKDEIIVIEMLGPARAPAAKAFAGPELRKLNDITTHFPGTVVWSKVEGRKGESTYAFTIRGDFERKHKGAAAREILAGLEAAMRASRFWTVIAPARGEFLRVEMRHD